MRELGQTHHAKNGTTDNLFFTVPRWVRYILVLDVKSRRYNMYRRMVWCFHPRTPELEIGMGGLQTEVSFCAWSPKCTTVVQPLMRVRRHTNRSNMMNQMSSLFSCLPSLAGGRDLGGVSRAAALRRHLECTHVRIAST